MGFQSLKFAKRFLVFGVGLVVFLNVFHTYNYTIRAGDLTRCPSSLVQQPANSLTGRTNWSLFPADNLTKGSNREMPTRPGAPSDPLNSLFQDNDWIYDCVTWEKKRKRDVASKRYIDLAANASSSEAAKKRLDSFVDIYYKQKWGGKSAKVPQEDLVKYKASGPGSALVQSQGVIALLHTVIERLKLELNKPVIKVLDLPCGDNQYMAYFLPTRDDIEYTGIDIVPALIQKHKQTYKNNTRYTFKQLDIVESRLNESYDLILCRMMLQHLKSIDVLKALYHFSTSGSKYLIATTFADTESNTDLSSLESYRFRPLNLEIAPINLSPPVCVSREPIGGGHDLAMWKLPLRKLAP